MLTLRQIRGEVERLSRRINAVHDNLPTYGRNTSRDAGYAHVEVDSQNYHYVAMERGEETVRKSTTDLDELLYWIFESATFSMAFTYELKNRIEDQDCRRIAFPKQLELMTQLSAEMGARAKRAIDEILSRFPYDDEPTRAVNRMRGANAT